MPVSRQVNWPKRVRRAVRNMVPTKNLIWVQCFAILSFAGLFGRDPHGTQERMSCVFASMLFTLDKSI